MFMFLAFSYLNPIDNFVTWIKEILQSLLNLGQIILEGGVILAVLVLTILAVYTTYRNIRAGATIMQAARGAVVWFALAGILAAVSVISPVVMGLRPTFAVGLREWATSIFQ